MALNSTHWISDPPGAVQSGRSVTTGVGLPLLRCGGLPRFAEGLAGHDRLRADPHPMLIVLYDAGANGTPCVPRRRLEPRIPLRVVRHREPPPCTSGRIPSRFGGALVRATTLLERERCEHRHHTATWSVPSGVPSSGASSPCCSVRSKASWRFLSAFSSFFFCFLISRCRFSKP